MNIRKIGFLMVFLTTLSLLLVACNVSESSTNKSKEDFYKGENIELVVPFGAGGGSDVFARFIAPYLGKYTSGEPTIQVVNIPGGESITGTNEYVKMREPNGLSTLTTSASTHTPFLLGNSHVQYDLREMEAIVGFPTGGVVYTKPELADSILNSNEELVYAGISATGLDLVTLLSFEVLGVDVFSNMGYEGRGPSRVAFEQGESNVDYQTSSAFITSVQPLVDKGEAKVLYSFGQMENGDLVRDPIFPDIPSLKEFYIELHGEEPSGSAWEAYKAFVTSSFTIQKILWMHGDAPDAAKQALKEGAVKMVEDETFLKSGEEVLGGYTPYLGDSLDSAIEEMLNVPEEINQWVVEFLESKYDVTVD